MILFEGIYNLVLPLQFTLAFEFFRFLFKRNEIAKRLGIPDDKRIKFNNIASSLLHSTLTGIGSSAALLFTDVKTDFIHGQSNMAYILLNLSLGYFIYDIVDTLRLSNWNILNCLDMILHHILATTAFYRAVSTKKFLGIGMFILLMEVHSIFLHSRSLLQFANGRDLPFYRTIVNLNNLTMIIFRHVVSICAMYWILTTNDELFDTSMFILTLFGDMFLIFGNILIHKKCYFNDFLRKTPIKS